MGEQETVKEAGERLAAVHGAGRVAAVAYPGGVAFFRRPTDEEHDSFVLYADDDASKQKAIRAYARACYLESLDGLSFDQVCEKAGPVWHKGPAMKAINRLAGATEVAPTAFF